MAGFRTAIDDFQLANPLYTGAQVSFFTTDGNGNSTGTLATLYAAATGVITALNPQTLDATGKFSAPVYIDAPVIAVAVGANIGSHTTGIIGVAPRNRGNFLTGTVYYSGDVIRDPALGDWYMSADNYIAGASVAADVTAGKLVAFFLQAGTQTGIFLDNAFELKNASDQSKIAFFDLSQISSAATRTFQLPDANTMLVGIDTAQTLTHKTFDTAGAGNVLKIAGTAISAISGTGAVVLASAATLTSPSLVTAALGTPASGVMTNVTGLPISTGVSGLGTGIAAALAINVGSAGAPYLVGGALGTPASGVATNLTGTASGLTAGSVTTNANLTGPVTSAGNATTIANSAITGQTLNNSPVAGNDYVIYYSAANNALQKATISSLISSGTAGVSTFNGRSGAVAPTSGDYTVAQVTGAAPLASPTLTTPAFTFATGGTAQITANSTNTGFINQLNVFNAGTVATAGTNAGIDIALTAVANTALLLDVIGGGAPAAQITSQTGCTGGLTITAQAGSLTLVTPNIGVATATSINGNTFTSGTYTLTGAGGKTLTFSNSITLAGTDGTTMTFPGASASIGYLNVPQNSQNAAYTTVLADSGKHIFHPSSDVTARTFTIDSNANVAYPVGTAITFVNQHGAGVVTIAITSDTMRLAGAGTTGSRTLAVDGIATALKVATTEWIISGTGLT